MYRIESVILAYRTNATSQKQRDDSRNYVVKAKRINEFNKAGEYRDFASTDSVVPNSSACSFCPFSKPALPSLFSPCT